MYKFDFTKDEVKEIKSKIYLVNGEEEVFDDRLNGLDIIQISLKRNMSTATVSRKVKNIYKKILKIKNL